MALAKPVGNGRAMKSQHSYSNGHDRDSTSSPELSEGSDDLESDTLNVVTNGWAERILGALEALRISRDYYDVIICGGGAELPAHRVVLAAASPELLRVLSNAPPSPPAPPPAYRVRDVTADALDALLHYAYTGRLRVRDAVSGRSLYITAWRLGVESACHELAERLVKHATCVSQAPRRHAHCLAARSLPDLPQHLIDALDVHIAANFEAMCESGAASTVPMMKIEITDISGADADPDALAESLLVWAQKQIEERGYSVEQLCDEKQNLVHENDGSVRGKPTGEPRPPKPSPAPRDAQELGVRALPRGDWRVLAAATGRALLALGGNLVLARVSRAGGIDAEAKVEARGRLARGRCAHGAAALGGRLLVCGGYDRCEALRDAESYDPTTNAWVGAAVMKGARARFGAASLGSSVYALGGSDGHSELDTVECLNVEGRWLRVARLPVPREHAAAVAADERDELYCIGGWNAGHTLRAVHKYEPKQDRWSEAPSLNVGRSQCAAAWWRGSVWALGGCSSWHCLSSVERLDVNAGATSWVEGPSLPVARRASGAAAWRGRLLCAGGSDGAASLKRVDYLMPEGTEWIPGPSLNKARANLSLSVLEDVVYAVGGFSGQEFLRCVESLHCEDQAWTLLRDPPPLRTPITPPPNLQSPEPKVEMNGIIYKLMQNCNGDNQPIQSADPKTKSESVNGEKDDASKEIIKEETQVPAENGTH